MKKVVLAVPLLALALGGTTACATKKFVRGEVGQVNDKVDTLSRSLEETQERTRANETKITEVGQAAAAADQRAQAAGKSADAANAAAAAVNTRADAIDKELAALELLAREQGVAVAAANALPVSIDRIARWAQTLEARKIALVPVSAARALRSPKTTGSLSTGASR